MTAAVSCQTQCSLLDRHRQRRWWQLSRPPFSAERSDDHQQRPERPRRRAERPAGQLVLLRRSQPPRSVRRDPPGLVTSFPSPSARIPAGGLRAQQLPTGRNDVTQRSSKPIETASASDSCRHSVPAPGHVREVHGRHSGRHRHRPGRHRQRTRSRALSRRPRTQFTFATLNCEFGPRSRNPPGSGTSGDGGRKGVPGDGSRNVKDTRVLGHEPADRLRR